MRFFLTITAFLLLVPGIVRAQGPAHGLSLFGSPALDKNFTHYPYVNPQAPKGGELRVAAIGSFDIGGANKIGPALWGIVDRDIAASTGFSYSSALSGKDGIWDYEALNGFLENPKKYATGTNMAFAGLRKAKDRANIIAYLDSLKD